MRAETHLHLRLEEIRDVLTGISRMVVDMWLDAQIHTHVDQLGERGEAPLR